MKSNEHPAQVHLKDYCAKQISFYLLIRPSQFFFNGKGLDPNDIELLATLGAGVQTCAIKCS